MEPVLQKYKKLVCEDDFHVPIPSKKNRGRKATNAEIRNAEIPSSSSPAAAAAAADMPGDNSINNMASNEVVVEVEVARPDATTMKVEPLPPVPRQPEGSQSTFTNEPPALGSETGAAAAAASVGTMETILQQSTEAPVPIANNGDLKPLLENGNNRMDRPRKGLQGKLYAIQEARSQWDDDDLIAAVERRKAETTIKYKKLQESVSIVDIVGNNQAQVCTTNGVGQLGVMAETVTAGSSSATATPPSGDSKTEIEKQIDESLTGGVAWSHIQGLVVPPKQAQAPYPYTAKDLGVRVVETIQARNLLSYVPRFRSNKPLPSPTREDLEDGATAAAATPPHFIQRMYGAVVAWFRAKFARIRLVGRSSRVGVGSGPVSDDGPAATGADQGTIPRQTGLVLEPQNSDPTKPNTYCRTAETVDDICENGFVEIDLGEDDIGEVETYPRISDCSAQKDLSVTLKEEDEDSGSEGFRI